MIRRLLAKITIPCSPGKLWCRFMCRLGFHDWEGTTAYECNHCGAPL